MKLGFVSDSLGGISFEQMLDTAANLGVNDVEMNTGGWSAAPHFDLAVMKQSPDARRAFQERWPLDFGQVLKLCLEMEGPDLLYGRRSVIRRHLRLKLPWKRSRASLLWLNWLPSTASM